MKHLLFLLRKWTLLLIALLKPLGIWGALFASALDSGTVPIPMDLLMATYVWGDRERAWLYVLMAAAGSAIGGLLPFLLGRAGGELFLLKHVDRVRYEALRARFERQEFIALLVPSMLPPPTPWKLFAFASGVFEMRGVTFVAAVFLGRLIRFGVEAVLTVRYGPRVMDEMGAFLRVHSREALGLLALVVGLGAWYLVRQIRKARRGRSRRRLNS